MTDLHPTETTPAQCDAVLAAATVAATRLAVTTDAERAGWLRRVADDLDAAADELIGAADEETALGRPRLTGELARTTAQLRLFADVIVEGSYLEATIDHPNPSATPPIPDLRRVLRPLGPVVVFAASNFPFAFSVAGGDTASALAVGCPVVLKAHPGHPRTSALTAGVVTRALAGAGAPEGTFALVSGFEAGLALVDDPRTRAVAFTGSVHGGRAILDRCAARPEPIPFYGELGSVNPVVVTAAADAARGGTLAEGLAASFQLGVGQFCTKPGIVFVPDDSDLLRSLTGQLGELPRMLTSRIAEGFRSGVGRVAAVPGVEIHGGGDGPETSGSASDPAAPGHDGGPVSAVVAATDVTTLLAHADVLSE
ncbi:MAG: aldehyde dehydrogenase family protein, partial [Mycetocola sp.]